MSASLAETMRPFLVSLDRDFVFRRLELLLGFSFLRFGFLLEAFRYGAPPHGGMAFGLDRLVMLLLGKESIKDVIAFPKVQNASELMSGCPAEVEDKSLAELAIKVDLPQE